MRPVLLVALFDGTRWAVCTAAVAHLARVAEELEDRTFRRVTREEGAVLSLELPPTLTGPPAFPDSN